MPRRYPLEYTSDEKAKAVQECLAAGENPESFLDYADLRNGVQNWVYFLEERPSPPKYDNWD